MIHGKRVREVQCTYKGYSELQVRQKWISEMHFTDKGVRGLIAHEK